MGSIRVARRAGKNVASTAAANRTAAAEVIVNGSMGRTWNNMVDNRRVSASEAMMPMAIPTARSDAPCASTSFHTLDC